MRRDLAKWSWLTILIVCLFGFNEVEVKVLQDIGQGCRACMRVKVAFLRWPLYMGLSYHMGLSIALPQGPHGMTDGFPWSEWCKKDGNRWDTQRDREVPILLLTGINPELPWEGMDTRSIHNRRQGLLGSILESRRKENINLFFLHVSYWMMFHQL